MLEAEQIMKRCQIGTRNYEEANNLHAECYRIIGKLLAERTWVGLTDEEENALIPDPDGSAEVNVKHVEVLPGAWGAEFEEVDAWSKPLVLQMLHNHEAKLKQKNGYAEEST